MTSIFYFAGMLNNHIKDSKLKLPVDFEKYNPEEYPHFHVFQLLHVGCPIDVSTLEDNANVIASIPVEDIKKVTLEQLVGKGLWIENSCNFV
jgi:hypothetical protein